MAFAKILQSFLPNWPLRRKYGASIKPVQLKMIDGVQIVVPDSLLLVTPYVLLEQEDWFEDELKFLRRALRPGQRVIDIGANYGVYTLPIAKLVGPSGCVWAFEPASRTAALLHAGIEANNFTQVVLEKSALSNSCGTAQLSMHDHSELVSLVQAGSDRLKTEPVASVTLDDCMQRYRWTQIDFMKVDAEGEEANILKGGQTFFSQLSPLIEYEVKAGDELRLNLVVDFKALGYASYRLVPALDLLIPFDSNAPTDGYLLNLFCCKRQLAEQLAADGLLVDGAFCDLPAARRQVEALYRSTERQYAWNRNIAHLPYGIQLSGHWENTPQTEDSLIIDNALSCYAISRDPNLSAVERLIALETSLGMFAGLCQRAPNVARLSSLARVAREFGARSLALSMLDPIVSSLFETRQVSLDEPFLVSTARFESIPPGDDVGNWVLASVLEAIEQLCAYSSFFTGRSAQERLELIASLGFGSEEMARRLRLVKARFGEHTGGQQDE